MVSRFPATVFVLLGRYQSLSNEANLFAKRRLLLKAICFLAIILFDQIYQIMNEYTQNAISCNEGRAWFNSSGPCFPYK